MTRPLPVPDPDTAEFWRAARGHELRLPRCGRCACLAYPPGPRCPRCRTLLTDWVTLSGQGTLHSWTVVHAPLVPGLAVPYVLGEVELAEQPDLVLVTELVDADPRTLALGLPVTVTWLDLDDEVTVPQFRFDGASR